MIGATVPAVPALDDRSGIMVYREDRFSPQTEAAFTHPELGA